MRDSMVRSAPRNKIPLFSAKLGKMSWIYLAWLWPVWFSLSAIAEEGLVAHWIFAPENVSGQTIKDLTGNFNGDFYGDVKLDQSPAALRLDPQDDLILPAKFGVTLGEEMSPERLPQRALSIETWARIDEPEQWGSILCYGQDNNNHEKGWFFGSNAGHFSFALATMGGDDGDGFVYYLNSAMSYNPGIWYHLVGTYDGSVQKLYVNGQLEKQTRNNFGYIDYPETAPFAIGNYRDDDEAHPFEVGIHEIRLYDRPLISAEVQAHYEEKKSFFDEVNKRLKTSYIKDWQVAGQYQEPGLEFQGLFDTAFAPEEPEGEVKWQPWLDGGRIVDFGRLFPGDLRVAYLRTRVWSPRAQKATLELGSDDSLKVWLNGTLVHANPTARPLRQGEDVVQVQLTEGWNDLLLKVTNGSGDWQASAKIRSPEGPPLEGIKISAEGWE
jgi:hypothetical protein